MRKKTVVLIALLIFTVVPSAVKAASEGGNPDIKSHGSIIYKDSNGSVELFAEDIAYLQEKLSSVPDEIFDPVLYSHTHEWEYINVNKNTHTRHCAGCGSPYDIVSAHDAATSRTCTITYSGKDYPGYEKTCRCGYTWKVEMYHNLIYSPADASYHTLSCALDGTDYCSGLETEDDEHVRTASPVDETHHQAVCYYCGYVEEIRECIFDYDSVEDSEDPTQVKKYCECGNFITEPKETVSGNDITGEETGDRSEEELPTGSPESGEPESVSENQTEAIQGGRT